MSDQPRLFLEHPDGPGRPVVRIGGEVDLHSSPAVRDALLKLIEDRPERLIVDLADVSYMDSSGVGTLVELKRRVERAGGKMVLSGLQQRVLSVFEITRLDRFFVIKPDLAEARKA